MLARSVSAELKEAELLEELRKDHEEQARAGVFLTTEDLVSAADWGRE